MPTERPDIRFQDILDNIARIESHVAGIETERDFAGNPMAVDAVERCLMRISEAAVKLGALAEELASDQPWADIRGIGNRLRHDYDDVLAGLIWGVIRNRLDPLKRDCQAALRRLG